MATQPKPRTTVEYYRPGKTPEFDRPLRLECGVCGKVGSYRVGVVTVSPRYFETRRMANDDGSAGLTNGATTKPVLHMPVHGSSEPRAEATGATEPRAEASGPSSRFAPADARIHDAAEHPADDLDDYVGFTRYFRCKHCDAGGPWKLTTNALWQLTGMMFGALVTKRTPGMQLAEMKILNGVSVRYPTESEALLRERIVESPTDPLLWLRLGNVLKNGGRHDLARPAYEEAIALDPAVLDAHACLADIHEARRATRMALHHWKEVLRHARAATGVPRRERLDTVSTALERALDLARDPNEVMALMPMSEPAGDGDTNEPALVHVTQLDFSNSTDWRRICRVFLGEPLFSRKELRARERAAGFDRSALLAPGAARSSASAAPAVPGSKFSPMADAGLRLHRTVKSGWEALFGSTREFDDPDERELPFVGAQVGRNDPCPCGSGRKYKRCCATAAQNARSGT